MNQNTTRSMVELKRSRRVTMNQNTTRLMGLSRRVCLRFLLNRNDKNSTLKVSLYSQQCGSGFWERTGGTRRNNMVFRKTVLVPHIN